MRKLFLVLIASIAPCAFGQFEVTANAVRAHIDTGSSDGHTAWGYELAAGYAFGAKQQHLVKLGYQHYGWDEFSQSSMDLGAMGTVGASYDDDLTCEALIASYEWRTSVFHPSVTLFVSPGLGLWRSGFDSDVRGWGGTRGQYTDHYSDSGDWKLAAQCVGGASWEFLPHCSVTGGVGYLHGWGNSGRADSVSIVRVSAGLGVRF